MLTRPIALRRLFVLGIGFFSLCFLMTSLGGQFSARRPGDSPFTIRTEGILVGKGVWRFGGQRRGKPLSLTLQEAFWGSVLRAWPPCWWTCEWLGF